jgi:hypothetical protein
MCASDSQPYSAAAAAAAASAGIARTGVELSALLRCLQALWRRNRRAVVNSLLCCYLLPFIMTLQVRGAVVGWVGGWLRASGWMDACMGESCRRGLWFGAGGCTAAAAAQPALPQQVTHLSRIPIIVSRMQNRSIIGSCSTFNVMHVWPGGK